MSKDTPDTTEQNARLQTNREASRKDHNPYIVKHLDDFEWETIRWPGETGKMLFHPDPHFEGEFKTETGGEIFIVQYPGPTTGERPIYSGRFNMSKRNEVNDERVDL